MTNIVKVEIGKGLTLDVDMDGIMAAPAAHMALLYNGCRNRFMDCHASVKREDYPEGDEGTKQWRDNSLAAAQKALDSAYKNEVRTVRATTVRVTTDPVTAEAQREARVFVYGRAKGWEKGKAEALAFIAGWAKAMEMPNLPGKEKDVMAAAIARRAAKPESIEAAKAIVVARASIAVPDSKELGL